MQQACSNTLYQASNYVPCHARDYKLYKTTLGQRGCTYIMQLTCYLQPHRLNKTAFVRTNLTDNAYLKKRSYKSVARHKHLSEKTLKNNRQSPSIDDDMVNILLTGAQLTAFDTRFFFIMHILLVRVKRKKLPGQTVKCAHICENGKDLISRTATVGVAHMQRIVSRHWQQRHSHLHRDSMVSRYLVALKS